MVGEEVCGCLGTIWNLKKEKEKGNFRGDEEEFRVYGFILWSALLAAG